MKLANTKIEEKRSVLGYKYNVVKFQLPKEHINTINDLIEDTYYKLKFFLLVFQV